MMVTRREVIRQDDQGGMADVSQPMGGGGWCFGVFPFPEKFFFTTDLSMKHRFEIAVTRLESLNPKATMNPSPPAPLHPVARGEDEKTCFIRVPKKRAAGVADGDFRDADGTFWGVKSTQRCFRFLWTTTPRVYEMACIQGSRELKGQGEKWMAGGIFKGNPPKECNRAHTSASRCTPSRHCRRI